MLEKPASAGSEVNGNSSLAQEIDRRIDELRTAIEEESLSSSTGVSCSDPSMGHSQFAEFIGARGPNTQINAACASTAQACRWRKTGSAPDAAAA